jgi:hypothetical protein
VGGKKRKKKRKKKKKKRKRNSLNLRLGAWGLSLGAAEKTLKTG